VRFKPASSGVPYVEQLNGSRTTSNRLRLAKSVRANFRYNCL
jgi:hypothetical protein